MESDTIIGFADTIYTCFKCKKKFHGNFYTPEKNHYCSECSEKNKKY